MLIRDRALKHTRRFVTLGALLVHIERSGIRARGIPASSPLSEAIFF
jgi:hypothetical protein